MTSDDVRGLTRFTRSLTRPGAGACDHLIAWEDFCDPAGQWLRLSVQGWQRLGGFTHHRAGITLVSFRASWLALCATIPEYHRGLDLPSFEGARVTVNAEGLLEGLVLPDRSVSLVPGRDRAEWWWRIVEAFIAPLTRALEALGGPPASSDQYWGNTVGLIGEVLRRLADDGIGGDVFAAGLELRSATGRTDLLSLHAVPGSVFSRRRTCCQLWRCGLGYCIECVLHDAPARKGRLRSNR
ncbi:hypothetical protein [Saccharopolyspora spinosa]|nr:hypothetical protein [Saccharopolyspora spinosa]